MTYPFSFKQLLLSLCCISMFVSACKEEDLPAIDPCTNSQGTRSVWTPFYGDSDTIPAFPDRYANYWAFGFSRANMPELGIQLAGTFPSARYMSVNVYDMGTKNSEGALLDELILPCSSPNGNYVINIVPSGVSAGGLENVLQFDAAIDSVAIMLRCYLPETDGQGGVDLPMVMGFNVNSRSEMALPVTIPLTANIDISQLQSTVAPFFLVEEDTSMWFYNINPDGLYANADNKYLATPITPLANEVYMVRFKAPQAGQDVRYWSLTQSNNSTYSFATLYDDNALVAADGYVNVVIAEPDAEISTKAAGLNLFPKEIQPNAGLILIYRNLYTEPDFAGDISQVPRITVQNIFNLPEMRAQVYIGEYAPIGKRMTRQQFLDDFGGFPVSY